MSHASCVDLWLASGVPTYWMASNLDPESPGHVLMWKFNHEIRVLVIPQPSIWCFFNIPTLHMVSSCCWWTLQLFCVFFFAFFLDKSHTSLVPIVATYSNLLMEPSFLAKIRSGFDCTLHTSLRSDCARKFRMEPKNWDVAKKYWFYMGSMQSSEGVISLLFRLPTPSFSQVQVPATSGLGFPVVLPVFT